MPHYYSEYQTSKLNLEKIKSVLRGKSFEFYTGSGVFSKKKVDKGTELLVDKCIVKDNWKVLDLGCGYGVVGVVIGKIFPKTKVLMVDFNRRALKLAKMNIELNNVENAEIRHSDLYLNVKEKFNAIIVNPPITAGRKTCFDVIEGAKEHLEKKGILQIVAKHRKGGKVLGEKMIEVFKNMEVIAKGAGYRVYTSVKK
ncbi:MAG: methyltransferase [Candidatus Nanoarchaeia archaeon]|nr:methyltransferase [Candidatus Nanoarchaeia archaeon]